MSEKAERIFKERAERRSQIEDLLGKGWISTGDLPYVIARKVPGASPDTIQGRMSSFLKMALEKQEKQNQNYRSENLVKIGARKTFVSPDLAQKIEEEVRNFYKSSLK